MAVGLALAVSMSLTACGWMGEGAMVDDPDLTKQVAITQTLKHLKRTEASLPEGMALSANSDNPDAVDPGISNSGSMTCSSSDGANPDTDPQLVYMSYFVTGVPEGQTRKYVMQIRHLWESWGWELTRQPDEQRAAYANEHGYALDVQVSVGESKAISLGGETPCIAAENFTGSDEVPQRIGKP